MQECISGVHLRKPKKKEKLEFQCFCRGQKERETEVGKMVQDGENRGSEEEERRGEMWGENRC